MVKRKKCRISLQRHPYWSITVLLVILCTFVTLACFQYYSKLQKTVKEESGSYLQEISKQIGVNIGKTIEDNFTILGTIGTVLKSADISTFDRLDEVVAEQQEHWKMEHILLIDDNGIAYDSNGRKVLLSSDDYLQEAIVARKRSMSTSQMMGDKECVVFALPLEGLTVEGTEMSALVATYDLATFDRLLSMTAFGGRGYGHIIRRDGTMVIRSSSPFAPQTGYNFLAALADDAFEGSSKAAVLADILEGQEGQTQMKLEKELLYMSYTPLKAQEWCLLTFVPVAVANAKSTLLFKITLLLCTVVTFVFAALLSIIAITSYRHKSKLEQLAYVDPVTGGDTIQHFYVQADALLHLYHEQQYALVYTNISKFKVLNAQLGRVACDAILRATSKSIQKELNSRECVGRLFADNFCVLLEYEDEKTLVRRLEAWSDSCKRVLRDVVWLPLKMEVGVYIMMEEALPLVDMIDCAKIALRETPHTADSQLHYTIYNEQVHHRLLREKQLEDRMAQALANHEFQVYLQPKYRTDTERIGGAEALVRWKTADEGMIYPDEFIALFEKNGFIVQLDLWVFEQVCRTLRAWMDHGCVPMRISVNCSRIHLKTPGFLSHYQHILERYDIPPDLLEIELTENVVFEDVVHLTQTIAQIHELGLSCSMDDFGSGYSSLNLIQDIPVDVLKLDKIFFSKGKTNLARTEAIVGSILTMARALSMETVAEGVEERAQVDMLKRLGCDYIQGYYFGKPMPIEEFEQIAFGQAQV